MEDYFVGSCIYCTYVPVKKYTFCTLSLKLYVQLNWEFSPLFQTAFCLLSFIHSLKDRLLQGLSASKELRWIAAKYCQTHLNKLSYIQQQYRMDIRKTNSLIDVNRHLSSVPVKEKDFKNNKNKYIQ